MYFLRAVPINFIPIELGIKKEDIVFRNIGNSCYKANNRVLFGKQVQVTVSDFSKIAQFSKAADIRGVNHVNIESRKNSKIVYFQKQVQIAALKNAKQKAKYLVESMGEELGELQCISEIADNYQGYRHYNDAVILEESSIYSVSQVQKIQLDYTITTKFKIK